MTHVYSPPSQRGRRMISLTHSSLWIFGGVSFHIPGSLSSSLEILDIIPKKQIYKRALQRRYFRAHLCTRVYTVVYTWVYSCVHTCILILPR